jgi:hypothetical protein
MINQISASLTFVINAVKYLLEFLTIVILGGVGAVLYVLPWLLKISALLIWLGGANLSFNSIHAIYAPFSPAIPLLALQFGVIFSMVSWMGILIRRAPRNYLWGGLAISGIILDGLSIGAGWLSKNWIYGSLFFHILPAALFALLLIVETMRLRAIYRGVGYRISGVVYHAKFQKENAG